ncbi:MAG: c-type cytochrome [Pseudomonadota bacterium]
MKLILTVLSLLALLGGTKAIAREAADNYRDYCALCHGLEGEGGVWRGGPLIGKSPSGLSNEALYVTIAQGRPDLGMPAFAGALSEEELADLVIHIGKLQGVVRTAPNLENLGLAPASVGAAKVNEAGRALFEHKCMECHSILGEGGRMAPDLTAVEQRLKRDQIYQAIKEPYANIVRGFEMRELVTADGQTLRGWARAEFTPKGSFQLYNADEQLWTTYFKRDLQSQRLLPRSLMPEGILNDLEKEEVEDLLEYLLSTKSP